MDKITTGIKQLIIVLVPAVQTTVDPLFPIQSLQVWAQEILLMETQIFIHPTLPSIICLPVNTTLKAQFMTLLIYNKTSSSLPVKKKMIID
jgi:hypothetical protein